MKNIITKVWTVILIITSITFIISIDVKEPKEGYEFLQYFVSVGRGVLTMLTVFSILKMQKDRNQI